MLQCGLYFVIVAGIRCVYKTSHTKKKRSFRKSIWPPIRRREDRKKYRKKATKGGKHKRRSWDKRRT